jgi:hypothetical protein
MITTGMSVDKQEMWGFQAMRIPDNSGWCIMFMIFLPPQKDYYKTMKEDNKKKLDWGLQQGVIKQVVQNGIVRIGMRDVMKTIIQSKDSGRLTTIVYWSPQSPSIITQMVIMETKRDDAIKKQVDGVCNSLTID